MLYSEIRDRWVFVVDKCSFPENSYRDVVNGIYSTVRTRQVIKVAKQEVKSDNLVQELVEPTCEINQNYLDEDLIHDDTYYLEMAAFEFQGTEFLVPTNQFVEKTDPDHFSTIFRPTSGTIETPYRFFGVTVDDFLGLMKYLYPLDAHNSVDELTIDNWIAILRLSTKWRMLSLREEAIQQLNDNINSLSAVIKMQLGKECMVTEWVRSSYVALVESEEHFTEDDVIAIGLDSATKLCELREQGYAGEWDIYCNRLTLEAHGTSNLIADRISQITSSAVDHLDYDDDDLVTAILDAHAVGNQRLMLDAWGRMARRLESLTLDEVERLTLEIAVMMWEVRLETRRAASSLVQAYEGRCDVEALCPSQSVSFAFASELEGIEDQVQMYASLKPDTDKGKEPAVYTYGDRIEDEEEIPDSALEPMPPKHSRTLFEQSLELRRRIVDLEQVLDENADPTLNRQLQKDLRRCRLSAQKWCTSVAGYSTTESTLDLSIASPHTVAETLEDMMTKLLLNNSGKLTLDGSSTRPFKWELMKSNIYGFTAKYRLEHQITASKVIDIILPVSKS